MRLCVAWFDQSVSVQFAVISIHRKKRSDKSSKADIYNLGTILKVLQNNQQGCVSKMMVQGDSNPMSCFGNLTIVHM
jgi:hypothetical protein